MTTLSAELSLEEKITFVRLQKPLHLLFWGTLLLAIMPRLALRMGDRSVTTDPIVAAVGLGLITAGLFPLAFRDFFPGATGHVAAGVTALYGFFFALCVASWFIPSLQSLDPRVNLLFALLRAAGLVAISVGLAEFSSRLRLTTLKRHWLITAALWTFCWPLPLAITLLSPGLDQRPFFPVLATLISIPPVVSWFLALQRMRAATPRGIGPGRRRIR